MISPPEKSSSATQAMLAKVLGDQRFQIGPKDVAAEADLETRKGEIATLVRDACRRKNITLSDEEVAGAAKAYFTERFAFLPPELGAASVVAKFWIHRVRLCKRIFSVAAGAGVLAVAVQFVVLRPLGAKREAEFRGRQLTWLDASNDLEIGAGRAELMLKGADSEIAQTPREIAEPLSAAAGEARRQLSLLGEQLHRAANDTKASRYSLEATARGAASDPDEAVHKTAQLRQAETEVAQLSRAADAVIARYRQLRAEENDLKIAWRNALSASLSPAALSELTTQRDLAQRAIDRFEGRDRVASFIAQISHATERATELAQLPDQIHAVSRRIESTSEDSAADRLSRDEQTRALAAVAAGKPEEARLHLSALHRLADQLEQDFTLRIVNQPNEYTRIWTYHNNNHAIKSYYIIVEAVGPDGQLIPNAIRSEEDGSVAAVSRWAERVDLATYEAVGQDKKDDGIVENDTFGRKRRGHLAIDYLMGPKTSGGEDTSGRIYRWPRKT